MQIHKLNMTIFLLIFLIKNNKYSYFCNYQVISREKCIIFFFELLLINFKNAIKYLLKVQAKIKNCIEVNQINLVKLIYNFLHEYFRSLYNKKRYDLRVSDRALKRLYCLNFT